VKLFEPGSLWSYKGYRLFWFSNAIFVLGASAFPIALAVTVLDAGGTATSLGLILGARVLSGVVFAPFAGVWADRLPRRNVMIGADLFRSAVVIAMVFVSAPSMPHYLLGLAVFLMGVEMHLAQQLPGQSSQALFLMKNCRLQMLLATS
jgi:MFS family permease